MLETGRSLAVAQSYLDENKGAAEVLTACLYTMDISEVRPDFFLRQVDQVVRGSTAVCRHFSLSVALTLVALKIISDLIPAPRSDMCVWSATCVYLLFNAADCCLVGYFILCGMLTPCPTLA